VVGILAGLEQAPGATVNRYCSSSLQTIRMAAHAIRAGEGEVFISAGVEMVSRYARGNSDALPPEAQAAVGGPWENPVFGEARQRSQRDAQGGQTWRDPRAEPLAPASGRDCRARRCLRPAAAGRLGRGIRAGVT